MSEQPKFNRGTALSIFKSDRMEDIMALLVSLGIVIVVVALVPIQ
ncbi:MAG: hypothetical protein OEZ39_15035 [Gammaproteobacteria bacterium]|nr:hypothetical protein [Gammaproteobacteria bacterium]MDH5653168.1 hypothetical protein [Gammaproteobacteria bacterium]